MTSKHRPHPDAGRRGETAADYITAAVPRGSPENTAAHAVSSLSGNRFESITLFCVTNDNDLLLGVIPIANLFTAAPEARLEELMWHDAPRVYPEADQEKIASLALHHVLNAIPVVDHKNHLLGVIPSEALLHILRREHVEDIHRIAGIGRETERAREAIESPPIRRVRDRLPWLLLGLVGSIFATWVVTRYEQALNTHVAIAFFVPGLVYLADAIGTQTEAIAVRGLSLSHVKLTSMVGGEMRTGVLIGLALGALTLPLVWFAFGDLHLAAGVALALVCAGGVATTIGLLLPWLLYRLGTDAAFGSGPLASVIQNVLTLLIYFAIVSSVVL
jgi:magnesium transporter